MKDIKKYLEVIKENIKESAKYEESLKSISFSIDENEKRIIIYFAWKAENYDKYTKERNIFRNNIINACNAKHLYLNKNQSTSAKYTFYYRDEIK